MGSSEIKGGCEGDRRQYLLPDNEPGPVTADQF